MYAKKKQKQLRKKNKSLNVLFALKTKNPTNWP